MCEFDACGAAAGSSEHVIRDLNDEINKRIREKRHWERRIVQLGGPDYARTQPQAYDADGEAVRGVGGYKYFGAAKNLPGVRELFQKEEQEPRKRSRQDMYKHIEPDYYGFRDDEDEQQLKDEQEAEQRLQQRAMDGWDAAEAKRKAQVAELVRTRTAATSIVEAQRTTGTTVLTITSASNVLCAPGDTHALKRDASTTRGFQ
ncbi:hypothetical protein ON010_g2536 [Phytophthora cinnamomi]|nr:hypothetical protein ON010_g2536 [Phytophthora cinnamomi]